MRKSDDEKKKRVNDYKACKYLLLLIPLAYALAGMGILWTPGSGSMFSVIGGGGGGGSRLLSAAVTVPVPKTPRTVIKFYDGNTVITYDHHQPGQNQNWWTVVNANVWEADTLAVIRHMLTLRPNSLYLDFGAWVGPTAIFASSYAKHVYAMEPDPGAFNELYYNVHMNPHIARNTDVYQLCISDGPGKLIMRGELGSSMSTLLEYPGAAEHIKNNNTYYQEYPVECMSLEQFMANEHINIKDVALIKMDTEGGEIKILPQLKPFIAKYKPNILLSLHAFLFKTNTAAHAAIKEVIGMYEHPIWLDGRPVDKAGIDIADHCHLCAMLLTDNVVTGADIAATNKNK